MDRITLRNIRCFSDEQIVPIRPITILVGENSSGKSTFLAAIRLAWDICKGKNLIDFNEDPFNLGSFEQIATYREGRTGRAKEFYIGAEFDPDAKSRTNLEGIEKVCFQSCFIQKGGKPTISKWSIQANDYQIKVNFGDTNKDMAILVITPSGTLEISELPFFPFEFVIGFLSFLPVILSNTNLGKQETISTKKPNKNDLTIITNLCNFIDQSLGSKPYPIAPIRTRPQVTYDAFRDIPNPEGSHIPILLARMSITDSIAWTELRKSLDAFGVASGLFDDVEIRRMGRKEGDPFQIRLKISGPPFNLVYVGYGVSQVLPIIVETLQQPVGTTFLLQQPEVHLHPKAQAELGSFLASAAKVGNKKFIIETHSDYLIDRIRMDVRDHKYIGEEDVVILYFERSGGSVVIHPIFLDKNGNLINTPENYRQFFLEEERRMILGE